MEFYYYVLSTQKSLAIVDQKHRKCIWTPRPFGISAAIAFAIVFKKKLPSGRKVSEQTAFVDLMFTKKSKNW